MPYRIPGGRRGGMRQGTSIPSVDPRACGRAVALLLQFALLETVCRPGGIAADSRDSKLHGLAGCRLRWLPYIQRQCLGRQLHT